RTVHDGVADDRGARQVDAYAGGIRLERRGGLVARTEETVRVVDVQELPTPRVEDRGGGDRARERRVVPVSRDGGLERGVGVEAGRAGGVRAVRHVVGGGAGGACGGARVGAGAW